MSKQEKMKSKELKQFLSKSLQSLNNLEIYSIMNCLSEEDLVSLYFDYNLEELVIRYIDKYNREQKRLYDKIISDLITTFARLSVSERRDLREILFRLAWSMNEERRKQIFALFSKSEDRIENRRAAQMSQLIWNEATQQKVIQLFRKKRDKFIAIELINNLSEEDIPSYFQELWNESLRDLMKQKLVEKIKFQGGFLEEFLKKASLKFYLLTLVKQKRNFEEVKTLYTQVDYNDRTYIKWEAGKMKCPELLLSLIELDKGAKEN